MSVLLILLAAWSLLLAAPLFAPWLGRDGSALAMQASAAALLVATRRGARGRVAPAACALALLGGYASFPAWVGATIPLGLALGLAPTAASAPLGAPPLLWLCALVTAPVLEELLYRERLFDPLRARLGAPAAILATSALFALPHLEAWSVLGTFLVGLALGGLRWLGGPVGLCIGAHAGLNLASLVCGSPPVVHALPMLLAGAIGLAACTAALALTRRHVPVTQRAAPLAGLRGTARG